MKRASIDRWSRPTTLHYQLTKAAELHQLMMMMLYHIASSSQKSTSKEDSATKEASNLNQEAFSMVDKEESKGQNRNRQIIRQKKQTLISKMNKNKSNLTHHCSLLRDQICKNWINRINTSSCMTSKEESDQEACSPSRSALHQLQSSLERLRQHQKYKASIQTIYLRI